MPFIRTLYRVYGNSSLVCKPQIVSNATMDVKQALRKDYIIGITLTRLIMPLYFWGCPVNFLGLNTNLGVTIGLPMYVIPQYDLHAIMCIIVHVWNCVLPICIQMARAAGSASFAPRQVC